MGAAQATRGERGPRPPRAIELRIETIGQLFHSLDPFPFRERDLDASVEEFVVGWAGELPPSFPLRIRVHLSPGEAGGEEAAHIGDAIRNDFSYRAEMASWDIRDLFRNGRRSLLTGIAVLGVCVALGLASERLIPGGYLRRFFDEALIILTGVANWRPIEIFLYDWAPIDRRRRLYRRLAGATVDLVPDG
jgi:hypothetical protein